MPGPNDITDPLNVVVPPPLSGNSAMPTPGANPNNPTSYQPSSQTAVVAPIVAAVTGGNAGNTIAGVQGAQKADNNFFGNIGSMVSDVTSKLGAVFNAGKASGASGAAIASDVQNMAGAQSQAIMQAGQAGANIVRMDALHTADRDAQIAKDAVLLRLDPNNPQAIAGMKAVADNAGEVFKQTGALAEMRANGFFDNPAKYLMDRVINMPIAEGRARSALMDTKEAQEAISAQTNVLRDRTVVDSALNSVNTVDRAGELYKQALAQTVAAGIDPMMKAQQVKIGAYELDVARRNSDTAAGNLAIAQAKLPGELEQQKNVAAYYGAAKVATIEQMNDKAALMRQEMEDKVKKDNNDATVLKLVNGTIQSFGGQGNVVDLTHIGKDTKDALLDLTANVNNFGAIARSPSKSVDLLNKANIPTGNMFEGHVATLDSINKLQLEGTSKALQVEAGKMKPTGQELKDKIDGYVTQSLIDQQVSGWSPKNSVFTLPSVGTLTAAKWAQDNPIVTAMRPLTVDGAGKPIKRDMDGSLLLNTAANLVNSGKLTENQAVTFLKEIGDGIMKDVQKAGGFQRFSIPLLVNQFNLTYQKSGFRIGNSNDKVNLLNSADTLNKLKLQRAGSKLAEDTNDIFSKMAP